MNAPESTPLTAGRRLRAAMAERPLIPFIGVHDVFSASMAGRHFDSLFITGFGFAASHYGLPDIGFITWTDIVDFVRRINTVLPNHNLLVDIDDGYCDPEVACHVVSVLEASGAAGVVLEDQKRPRRCGHFDGKQIMDLDEYLAKLRSVLATRRDLVVVARTDSSDPADIERRIKAFAEAGADAVLVDGLKDLDVVRDLVRSVDRPFCFNQIAGGKSPPYTQNELREAGISLVIYSTPCLFAAQAAMEDAMLDLKARNGTLAGSRVGVKDCTAILQDNLARRNERS
ncbi:MAG: isocitrate lyase/PEP mutase family protein [Betaproteobacteria bacterium]|jgi:2-methylisocitrate lyase-like PEP mutase family enzyme|nr:isocitrate lyase/PEP mutase family protein [Betaproteobacteria bacterium]HMV19684.1 isocitrate lyase/PEP mutase family protein [Rhodocyclaceae bacterium]HMW76480.1 isocitrate lyase/PEP mutase family protein [Rhodocyclaceae bacterium]HNE42411.1 isocitrate lyase/PEP mutase family protein [Rhodocyclaceae bacterium]HNL21719.1 isocitrate lyase/PEP mutase family protein [Rhodocyclaceae bacterium]